MGLEKYSTQGVSNMKTIYKVLICLGLGICFIIGGMSLNGINEMNEMTGLSFFHWQWHSKEIGDRHFESNESVNELKVELYKAQIEFHESHDLNHVVVDAKLIVDLKFIKIRIDLLLNSHIIGLIGEVEINLLLMFMFLRITNLIMLRLKQMLVMLKLLI